MFIFHRRQQVRGLLASVTGLNNQKLVVQNENLAAENRILRSHLRTRLRFSNLERSTLAEIGKRLGRKGIASFAFPGFGASLFRTCR